MYDNTIILCYFLLVWSTLDLTLKQLQTNVWNLPERLSYCKGLPVYDHGKGISLSLDQIWILKCQFCGLQRISCYEFRWNAEIMCSKLLLYISIEFCSRKSRFSKFGWNLDSGFWILISGFSILGYSWKLLSKFWWNVLNYISQIVTIYVSFIHEYDLFPDLADFRFWILEDFTVKTALHIVIKYILQYL